MEETRGLQVRDLLKINGSSLAVLAVGFLSTLLIPKMAISAMGVERYGDYALLLGFCMIPLLMDFGLMVGLTREIGSLHAAGSDVEARALARRFQLLLGGAGAVATVTVAAVVAVSHGSKGVIFTAVLAGAFANVLTVFTDIGFIRVRVAGAIIIANSARAAYYLSNLLTVGALFLAGCLDVTYLFVAQLLGALVYAAIGGYLVKVVCPAGKGRPGPLRIPWKRLFHLALPEQVTRIQGSLLPSAERGMMYRVGGAGEVGAFDIALRLSAIVTTLPAIIAEPMVALLSPRMTADKQHERKVIMRYSVLGTYVVIGCTLSGGLLLAIFWAIDYYHMRGTRFLPFAALIMLGSAFNVLTATRGAALYAWGKPGAITLKSLGDLAFAAMALGAMVALRNSLLYVAIRYLGYFVTAGSLLWYCRRLEKDQH